MRWGIIIFLAVIGFGLGVAGTFFTTTERVITTGEAPKSGQAPLLGKLLKTKSPSLRGQETGQTNALILGIGGENYPAGHLTDTIILASFNHKIKKITLISIPRDLAVPVPGKNYFKKINALYAEAGGTAEPSVEHAALIKKTIEKISGLPLHYTAVANLAAVQKIVDIVGGVNVPVDATIYDTRFPTADRGYETYEIREGWRFLDGKEALKYIRSRHTEGGDFARMRRQQILAWAVSQKLNGLSALERLPKLIWIYKELKDNIASDVPLNHLQTFWQLSKDIPTENITMHRLTSSQKQGEALLRSRLADWSGERAYVLEPRAGRKNYQAIQKFIQNVLEE